MANESKLPSDVLQSHAHSTLSAEQIAKAVARHNKDHKGAPKDAARQNPKAAQKKSGKH
jgi:hypothetical protein